VCLESALLLREHHPESRPTLIRPQSHRKFGYFDNARARALLMSLPMIRLPPLHFKDPESGGDQDNRRSLGERTRTCGLRAGVPDYAALILPQREIPWSARRSGWMSR
jgi:hypothetical protein